MSENNQCRNCGYRYGSPTWLDREAEIERLRAELGSELSLAAETIKRQAQRIAELERDNAAYLKERQQIRELAGHGNHEYGPDLAQCVKRQADKYVTGTCGEAKSLYERAADEIERLTREAALLRGHEAGLTRSIATLTKERDEAREAARWWYRRDRRSHDPSVITDQLQLWPWLEEGR